MDSVHALNRPWNEFQTGFSGEDRCVQRSEPCRRGGELDVVLLHWTGDADSKDFNDAQEGFRGGRGGFSSIGLDDRALGLGRSFGLGGDSRLMSSVLVEDSASSNCRWVGVRV